MDEKNLQLTKADLTAIEQNNMAYINDKGAKLYCSGEDYIKAMEYYHLSAAMGCTASVTNLGYCYLYGKCGEANVSLALGYFKAAANQGDVDALYKLGDIYGRDTWGLQDKELSAYYYLKAIVCIVGDAWQNKSAVMGCDQLQYYPSLCFALAREFTAKGSRITLDLEIAYHYLCHAKLGYERELENGSAMFEKSYQNLLQLMQDSRFDSVRHRAEYEFDIFYGTDE